MLTEFAKAFIMMLVIMNPFGGIPVFLSLTKRKSKKNIHRSANRAAFVAGIIIIIFLFLGKLIMDLFGITIEGFKIGGGIIILILGIIYVFDINLKKETDYKKDITVPMATPIIAGPGVLTTTIIQHSLFGFQITFLAIIINLFIFWILMYYSDHLHNLIGNQGTEIISRIMGLILTVIAVEFIISGVEMLI